MNEMEEDVEIDEKISVLGERAAVSGYKAQYAEFARMVYDCILDKNLVEIRVADIVESVGKLDDVCYVTHQEVHAMQIKTTSENATFGYPAFEELLPGVVDGWVKLKGRYAGKKVIPYLWTNRVGTTNGYYIRNKAGETVGLFSEFRKEVLERLHKGEDIEEKWQEVVDALYELVKGKKEVELSKEDWNVFWRDFDFRTDHTFETISIDETIGNQGKKDLKDLENLIEDTAAGKQRKVVLLYEDIIRLLGWETRVKTLYDHELHVDMESYEPIQQTIKQLNAQLAKKTKGFIFLEGSPGSGKSTLLTQWTQSLPNKCIRYYAFDFTNASSQWNNDSKRGGSMTFLYDLVQKIADKGFHGKKRELIYQDEGFLKQRLKEQLVAISEEYQSTQLPILIVVDGLDHVHREYTSLHGPTLLQMLPSKTDLPEGVIFVLGSQYYEDLGLNPYTLAEYKRNESTVRMSAFTSEEIGNLAKKLLGEKATAEIVEALVVKSAGYPLYLCCLLNQIKENPAFLWIDMPDVSSNIETYYEQLIGGILGDEEKCHFLGLLARVAGSIRNVFLHEWPISQRVQAEVLGKMGHLLQYDKNKQTRVFFHNSFRQYLLRQTAYDYIDKAYSEERDKSYYRHLAQLVRESKVENQWNIGLYLYKGGEYDEFVELLTPEYIIDQVHHFRPIWHIRHDIRMAAEIAWAKNDPYLMLRVLLLQSQINQMDGQEYSSVNLVEDLMRIGEGEIAKNQIQDDNVRKCEVRYALQLSRDFYHAGDMQEAEFLFNASYPQLFSESYEQSRRRRYGSDENLETCEEWVRTAVYFRNLETIEEKILLFVTQLKKEASYEDDEFDEEAVMKRLKFKVVLSLMDLHRWEEADEYIKTFPKDDHDVLRFRVQKEKVKSLIPAGREAEDMPLEYGKLQAILEAYTGKVGDQIYLEMAILAQQAGMDSDTIALYLGKVRWEALYAITSRDSTSQHFDKIRSRILYVELKSYLSEALSISELVPDEIRGKDGETLKQYLTMIYYLAILRGRAEKADANDWELMQIVKYYLTFFDRYSWMGSNEYAYMLGEHRGAFYEYMVQVAGAYGIETVRKVGAVVEELYLSDSWKAKQRDVRKIACALYQAGIDAEWFRNMLERIEEKMFDGLDLTQKQEEAIYQGRAWGLLGDNERAYESFRKLMVESLGVGYRKDFQPTVMARWICEANQSNPERAVERLHWMTSRLHGIAESCETRTAEDAGRRLFRGTMELNIGMGLKLGRWLLDSDISYFEGVSSVLIEQLLAAVRSEEEYRAVLRYFNQIHLFTMSDWYEVDTDLLEQVYDRGKILLGEHFEGYLEELRQAVSTQCLEKAQDEMLTKLDAMEHSQEETKELEEKDIDNDAEWFRESDRLVAKAERMLSEGRRVEAWDTAVDALRASNIYGWSRSNDGGTRLNACALLMKMDEQKGRELTMRQLADDISQGVDPGSLSAIDEIAELLIGNVDVMRLYAEKERYMNGILREGNPEICDNPEVEPNKDGVQETIVKWLIYIAKMPIIDMSDRAKMLLARMVTDGVDVVQLMREELCSVRDILEVGMYVRELAGDLEGFREIARENEATCNYQLRLYARTILEDMGEEVQTIEYKPIPAIYDLALPMEATIEWEEHELGDGYVDWDDAMSVMSVGQHIISYLSDCTGIEEKHIATRAYQLLKQKGVDEQWDDEEQKKLMAHYESIVLRYPFRRPRSMPILDSIMEVAGELIDGGVVAEYDDSRFMTKEFAVIDITEQGKPDFVKRIAEKGAYSVSRGWEYDATQSKRLSERILQIDGRYVIGEMSYLIKPGDTNAYENFYMKISCKTKKSEPMLFFGSTSMIYMHEGYFAGNAKKSEWLTMHPVLACQLGWTLSEESRWIWVNENGEKMVESVYWRNGNTGYNGRANVETGEGWYILASKAAMLQLEQLGTLYAHRQIIRHMKDEIGTPTSHAYVVRKIDEILEE